MREYQPDMTEGLIKGKEVAPPHERLTDLADLFAQRNTIYGNSYLQFGPVGHALFPGGLTLQTPDEWNRFALFFMCILKLHRYAMKYEGGGQADSLDDLAVYSQMLAYVDELNKEKLP